jgi:dihydrodipicolinate synthase/N-acetylneuraminate lyase
MLVTPFDADGEVDEQSLGRLVDHVLAAGPAGIAAFGLASETHTLAEDERRRLAEFILARVGGRLPVLITVTAESTPLAVGLARHAQQHGAAVLMLAPPRVTRTGAAGLARHYSAVAAAVDLPIMIQDAPGYIGVGLGAGLIAEIVREHANVRSVKTEALPAASAIAELRAQLGDAVAIFSGNGGLYLLDTFRGGAAGAIPGCDIPECFVTIYRAYDEGRIEDAEVLFGRLLPLLVYQNQSLDLLIATTKALLAHRGIIANDSLRPPAPPLDRRGKQEIVALYERATAPQEQGRGT